MIGDALSSELNRLAAQAGDARLVAALESLRAASGLVDVVTPQVIDLSAIWFPSPADTPQTTAAAVARLGAERTDYAQGVANIRLLDVPVVVEALVQIEADSRVQTFDRAVSASVAGEPLSAAGAPLDTDKVAETFRGHLALTPCSTAWYRPPPPPSANGPTTSRHRNRQAS